MKPSASPRHWPIRQPANLLASGSPWLLTSSSSLPCFPVVLIQSPCFTLRSDVVLRGLRFPWLTSSGRFMAARASEAQLGFTKAVAGSHRLSGGRFVGIRRTLGNAHDSEAQIMTVRLYHQPCSHKLREESANVTLVDATSDFQGETH